MTDQEAGGARDERQELRAELTRAKAEIDRLRRELAARVGPSEMPSDGALDSTLFISEIEVRRAVARQLQNGARLLAATKCFYLLFDGKNELIAQRPALGLEEEQLTRFRVPVGRGISGQVFRTRKPMRLAGVDEDERAQEEPLNDIEAKGGICVPLMVQIRDEENRVIDSRAIGVLWVLNRRGGGAFSDDDERLLTVFARQVAAVVSNAKIFQDMLRQNRVLDQTFENLPAGLLFIGEDERIRLINGTARKLFGMPDGRGVGEPYYRSIEHNDTCNVLAACLTDGEDKVRRASFEFEDETRTFQIQAARVRHGDEDINGVVAIFDDVSEIERVERMKQEFVQTFTVELLGPLSSIRGFSQMLERATLADFDLDMRMDVQRVIGQETERLRRHIQDLLNVSRFEQGIKVHLNITRFDPKPMVRRVVDQQQATARKHPFELDMPEDLPMLMADEQRIEEVLYNLVNNAISYSPDGGTVTVRARELEGGLQFEVSDEGFGIAPEHHEEIFNKFTRLQTHDERVRSGRGIGLFISRFFVEAHGGRISVQSAPGKGSTFAVWVPLQPVKDSGGAQEHS